MGNRLALFYNRENGRIKTEEILNHPDGNLSMTGHLFVLTTLCEKGTNLLKDDNGKYVNISRLQKELNVKRTTVYKIVKLFEELNILMPCCINNTNTWKMSEDICFCAQENFFEDNHKSWWQDQHSKYLQTKRWKDKRILVLERDNNQCQKCGSTDNLHVHHLTYKHWRNEELEELITLCSSCHSSIHNKGGN